MSLKAILLTALQVKTKLTVGAGVRPVTAKALRIREDRTAVIECIADDLRFTSIPFETEGRFPQGSYALNLKGTAQLIRKAISVTLEKEGDNVILKTQEGTPISRGGEISVVVGSCNKEHPRNRDSLEYFNWVSLPGRLEDLEGCELRKSRSFEDSLKRMLVTTVPFQRKNFHGWSDAKATSHILISRKAMVTTDIYRVTVIKGEINPPQDFIMSSDFARFLIAPVPGFSAPYKIFYKGGSVVAQTGVGILWYNIRHNPTEFPNWEKVIKPSKGDSNGSLFSRAELLSTSNSILPLLEGDKNAPIRLTRRGMEGRDNKNHRVKWDRKPVFPDDKQLQAEMNLRFLKEGLQKLVTSPTVIVSTLKAEPGSIVRLSGDGVSHYIMPVRIDSW